MNVGEPLCGLPNRAVTPACRRQGGPPLRLINRFLWFVPAPRSAVFRHAGVGGQAAITITQNFTPLENSAACPVRGQRSYRVNHPIVKSKTF